MHVYHGITGYNAGLCVSLVVLLGCYGVAPERVTKDWKCARCKANALTEVSVLLPLVKHVHNEMSFVSFFAE